MWCKDGKTKQHTMNVVHFDPQVEGDNKPIWMHAEEREEGNR